VGGGAPPLFCAAGGGGARETKGAPPPPPPRPGTPRLPAPPPVWGGGARAPGPTRPRTRPRRPPPPPPGPPAGPPGARPARRARAPRAARARPRPTMGSASALLDGIRGARVGDGDHPPPSGIAALDRLDRAQRDGGREAGRARGAQELLRPRELLGAHEDV